MRRTIGWSCFAALALPGVAAAAAAPSGGAPSVPAPEVTKVACLKKCTGAYAKAGSVMELRGRHLEDTAGVQFLGTRFPGDEAAPVVPRKTGASRVLVTVPRDAAKGRLVVTNAEGLTSKPSPVAKIAEMAKPRRTGGPIATVVTGKKAFFDGERQPTLTYELNTPAPARVVVSVMRLEDRATVVTFDQGSVEPGVAREVSWDGTVKGVAQREGRYAFVVAAAGNGVSASTAQASAAPPDQFLLLDHRFPVRGKHTYGDGMGAGRGHQGVDVFARCGTPIVAARGGTVKITKFQARAGNYIVIDEAQSGVDSAYMHLRDPALPGKAERVRTGEVIGYVGDTGRASGCHLHFERWSAPGWYTGGSPFDPLPELRAWDEFS